MSSHWNNVITQRTPSDVGRTKKVKIIQIFPNMSSSSSFILNRNQSVITLLQMNIYFNDRINHIVTLIINFHLQRKSPYCACLQGRTIDSGVQTTCNSAAYFGSALGYPGGPVGPISSGLKEFTPIIRKIKFLLS